MQTISSISEFKLISYLEKILKTRNSPKVILGIGDDAAAIQMKPGYAQLISSDAQVEDTHFNLRWIDPTSLGKRSISVSFSDIAAMGGIPKYSIVSLILPENLKQDFFQKLFVGIREQSSLYGCMVIGGNLSGGSSKLIIDITVLGEIKTSSMLTRSNALPGDHLYISGMLGEGAVGLELLRKYNLDYPVAFKEIVDNYLTPTPRLKAGAIIAASGYATSMIDISDGLSSDLEHICRKSKVGAEIYYSHLPRNPLLDEIPVLTMTDMERMILHGGDCYELLFTLKPDTPQEFIRTFEADSGVSISKIGMVVHSDRGITLFDHKNKRRDLKPHGWDHFG